MSQVVRPLILNKCDYSDCGHEWVPHKVGVRSCPRCGRKDWDQNKLLPIRTTRIPLAGFKPPPVAGKRNRYLAAQLRGPRRLKYAVEGEGPWSTKNSSPSQGS